MGSNRLNLEKLERLAKAASPGPWSEDDGNIFSAPLSDERSRIIRQRLDGIDVPHPDEAPELDGYPLGFVAKVPRFTVNFENDTAFIAAADPKTVLRLIALVRKLRAESPTGGER